MWVCGRCAAYIGQGPVVLCLANTRTPVVSTTPRTALPTMPVRYRTSCSSGPRPSSSADVTFSQRDSPITSISLRSRADLVIENMALRQQLAVPKTNESRPRLSNADRAFWVFLQRTWPRWREALIIVRPETVVRWHRQGFKTYPLRDPSRPATNSARRRSRAPDEPLGDTATPPPAPGYDGSRT